MAAILFQQLEELRAQMLSGASGATTPAVAESEGDDEDD
jgi:hypothetical protein